MVYLLHYTLCLTQNDGTKEAPNIVEYFQECVVSATDFNYDAQMAFAKTEAYNGEVTVEEVPDPEEPSAPAGSVWDELDAAYREGVNSAYDQ